MTSHREEALLLAAYLQIQTSTFLWVSSLPTYHTDFILASPHNYVNQFCKINLTLHFLVSSLLQHMEVPSPGMSSDPQQPPTLLLQQHDHLTHCREATNPIMPQQELHKQSSLTQTHIHTLILLLQRILTKIPTMTLIALQIWSSDISEIITQHPSPTQSCPGTEAQLMSLGQTRHHLPSVFLGVDLHAFAQPGLWLISLYSLTSLDVIFTVRST